MKIPIKIICLISVLLLGILLFIVFFRKKHAVVKELVLIGIVAASTIGIYFLIPSEVSIKNRMGYFQEENESSGDVAHKDRIPDRDTEKTTPLLQSERIQKYNDLLYTAYDLELEGWTSISGIFTDTFLIYNDKLYWRDTGGLGRYPCELVRKDLDGSNSVVITEQADSGQPFYIYDNELYYVNLDENMATSSCKINLDTLEKTECEPYYIKSGDGNQWLVGSLQESGNNTFYTCLPGFKDICRIDYQFTGKVLGMHDKQVYFVYPVEGGYTTSCYDTESQEVNVLLQKTKKPSVLEGNHLYYAESREEMVLCCLDLDTKNISKYGLGDVNIYMGRKLYEVGDDLYFIQFKPKEPEENTELWKLDKIDGSYEYIGSWYNETAVNVTE